MSQVTFLLVKSTAEELRYAEIFKVRVLEHQWLNFLNFLILLLVALNGGAVMTRNPVTGVFGQICFDKFSENDVSLLFASSAAQLLAFHLIDGCSQD